MAKCVKCGKKGLFLKINESGLCESCETALKYTSQIEKLQKEKQEVENLLTPEMKDCIKLKKTINEYTNSISDLKLQMQNLKDEISKFESQHKQLKMQLIHDEEAIELEDFSLYKPFYDFANSDNYKEKLQEIRNKQKDMIKQKIATICSTNWTVDGSKAKGKVMINNVIKLVLKSFNNECDAAVSSVKFNNYDRCENRIIRSFDTINKAANFAGRVQITEQYKKYKIEELKLALEYQLKKQQEKEELKELRAQQREEAKLAKEIEEARKNTLKEQTHYLKAKETLERQISECSSENLKKDLNDKLFNINEALSKIDENLKSIDYREANIKAGYVYIISNIGSFGENIYKIGMTRRLEPMDRINELGDASVPFNFDVHAMIFSDNAPKLEAALHKAFENKKLNMVNHRREFFNVTLDEIKKVVKNNYDKTVEFSDIPQAEQYRESKKIRIESH